MEIRKSSSDRSSQAQSSLPIIEFTESLENLEKQYDDFSTCRQAAEMKTLNIFYQTHFEILLSNTFTFQILHIFHGKVLGKLKYKIY